jgi:hypothetical protein
MKRDSRHGRRAIKQGAKSGEGATAGEKALTTPDAGPPQHSAKRDLITYDDYVKEREHLSKYEAANYENYEKQILTLAAAFLAFSVSFIAILRNKPNVLLTWHSVLIASWICFAGSVLSVLLSFPINAIATRSAVEELERLLDGKESLETMSKWTIAGYVLYGGAGLTFLGGLILLLMFCAHNIHIF